MSNVDDALSNSNPKGSFFIHITLLLGMTFIKDVFNFKKI
jgi:hypothetical protein